MSYRYYSDLLFSVPAIFNVATVGIPGLPDLTQPSQLNGFVTHWVSGVLVIGLLVIGLGLTLALVNFTLKPQQADAQVVVGNWVGSYTRLVRLCQQAALVLSLLVLSFFLCSTLANRYHFWEQAKFGLSQSQPIEQVAPQIQYTVKEPFSYNTQLNGRVVKVQDRRDVTKVLSPTDSNLQVKVVTGKALDASSAQPRDRATISFVGEYTIKNVVPANSNLTLLMPPPTGAALIQNFMVEQDGQPLTPQPAGVYTMPLAVNASSRVRVSYQAQGAPRWVYNPKGQMLSGFQLVVNTDTKNLTALGSLSPSQVEERLQGKTFNWTFANNVTVAQPFGIAPLVSSVKRLGIFPRLLIVAPAIWLWWLILLALSLPLRLRDIAVTSGVFIAVIWTLVYGSRLVRTELASSLFTPEMLWLSLSAILVIFTLVLSRNQRTALTVISCTVVGLVLPILALISSYSGLLLGVTALLSLGWLATPQWYGRQQRRSRRVQPPTVPQESLLLESNLPLPTKEIETENLEQ